MSNITFSSFLRWKNFGSRTRGGKWRFLHSVRNTGRSQCQDTGELSPNCWLPGLPGLTCSLSPLGKVPRLIWCRTPKVATTTWARIMLQLYGVKKFEHYHSQMKRAEKKFISNWNKKKAVSSLTNKNRKYWSLILARHPMERLFSAYRDKILRKSIIVKNLNKGDRKPTFRTFLTYLAMESPVTYNRHWKPNWILCNPCKFHYDFIIKMETFSRDSGGVLREIGASDLADINHLNSRSAKSRPPLDWRLLLEDTPSHVLEKILEIFHLDFVMFGYDKEPLLEILRLKKEQLEKNVGNHSLARDT